MASTGHRVVLLAVRGLSSPKPNTARARPLHKVARRSELAARSLLNAPHRRDDIIRCRISKVGLLSSVFNRIPGAKLDQNC